MLEAIAGIRRTGCDRAKERVFSPRGLEGGWTCATTARILDQFNASPPPGAHLRIHPILHGTRPTSGLYLRENIPIIPLYLAPDGKRTAASATPDITFPSLLIFVDRET